MKKDSRQFQGQFMRIFFIIVATTMLLTYAKADTTCMLAHSYYTVCYESSETEEFKFINCSIQFCYRQRRNDSTCLEANYVYYDEAECSQEICFQRSDTNKLKDCIMSMRNGSEGQMNNSQVIIAVVITIVTMIVFCAAGWWFVNKFNVEQDFQRELRQRREELQNDQGLKKLRIGQTLQGYGFIYEAVQDQKQNQSLNSTFSSLSSNYITPKQAQLIALAQSSPIILSLPPVNRRGHQDQVCCICLNLELADCQTQCLHYYHANCLSEWMKRDQTCPNCRSTELGPVKVYCTDCGKVRDLFRFYKGHFTSISRVRPQVFNRNPLCSQCQCLKERKKHKESTDVEDVHIQCHSQTIIVQSPEKRTQQNQEQ